MTVTLEALRARLESQEAKKDKGRKNLGDNASYPFWNLKTGTSALVRFLPDGDPDNVFFWVEKQSIKLRFQGVAGDVTQNHDKEIVVSVPCLHQWGEDDPILTAIRPWWNDPLKENVARQYWKKRAYLFQGFVVNEPLGTEEEKPENPIRRFVLNSSIFDIIKESLINPEMDVVPTDYTEGRDFKISKTQKGDYANYTTSQWTFKTRALSEIEQIAIAEHGVFDLKEYLGKRPDKDEKAAIFQMFEDSLAGHPYDYHSYGKYYTPYGLKSLVSTDEVIPKVLPVAERSIGVGVGSALAKGEAGEKRTSGGPITAAAILERYRKKTLDMS